MFLASASAFAAARSFAAVAGDELWITTDLDAPHKRVMRAPLVAPDVSGWTELVPEREAAVLETAVPAGGRLVLTYLEDARTRLFVRDPANGSEREVELDALGSAGISSARWDAP